MLVGLRSSFRHTGALACGVAGLALLAAVALVTELPSSSGLSSWRPEALFPRGLRVRLDQDNWPLAVAMMVSLVTVLVTGLVRPGGRRLAPRTGSLLIGLTALTAIMAEDFLTLAVAWSALDVAYFLALLSQTGTTSSATGRAVASLAANAAGTFAVVVSAAVQLSQGQSASFDGTLTSQAVWWLLLAALLRLGLFPPGLALAEGQGPRQGLSVLMRLAPATAALAALVRIARLDVPESTRPWLTTIALAAILFGGLQILMADDARRRPASFLLTVSGLALFAATWGQSVAAPATGSAAASGLLVGTMVFLRQEAKSLRPLERLVHALALAMPVISLLLLGAWMAWNSMTRPVDASAALIVWPLASGLAVGLLGVGVWRRERQPALDADSLWARLAKGMHLDGAYRGLWAVYRSASAKVLDLAAVLEGSGAVLWTLCVVLLMWILVRQGQPHA